MIFLDESCTLILRLTSRKAHKCRHCRKELPAGDTYVEYVGETSAFQSGTAYCVPCTITEWANWLMPAALSALKGSVDNA